MKRMSYATLMKKVEDGSIEIDAWSSDDREGQLAMITKWKANGTRTRETVIVTNIPAHIS
jgi:hypothetical protein